MANGKDEFIAKMAQGMEDFSEATNKSLDKLFEFAEAAIKAGDAADDAGDKLKNGASGFKSLVDVLKGFNPLSLERLKKAFGDTTFDNSAESLAKIRGELERIQRASRSQTNKDIFGQDIESLKQFEASLNTTTKKNKTNLDEQGKAVDALKGKVDELVSTLEKLSGKVGKKNVLKISIENSGFQRIIDDMNRAMTNFYKRNGKSDSFFDPKALRQKINEDKDEIVDAVKSLEDIIGDAFSKGSLKKNITTKIADIINQGVLEGIKNGSEVSGVSLVGLYKDKVEASEWAALFNSLKDNGITTPTAKSLVSTAVKYRGMNSEDKLELGKYEAHQKAITEIKVNESNKAAEAEKALNRQIHEEKMTQIEAENKREMELMVMRQNPEYAQKLADVLLSEKSANAMDAWTSADIRSRLAPLIEQKAIEELNFLKLKNEAERAKAENERAWSSRKEAVKADAKATDLAMEQQMLELQGRELTGMDEAIMKMTHLLGIRKELEDKMEDGVRIEASQIKNWQDLAEQVRVIAKEQYKIQSGYEDQNKSLEKALKLTQSYDQKLQAIGNMLSGMVRLWDKIGSGVQSIFGRVRNNIVNMFAQGRSEIRSLVSDATDQYSKLERAQIGFSNFFGADSAKKLVSQIQKEAIAAPSLSSGDLADYVSQLAPVSGGNADLALNATMGVLKAIQYSGSSASTEMWRVVTNIRDVMSKGTATTVDIRQFNKAMPAIEKALSDIGASEFLSNGQLKITKENAKQIVEMFARLNTDSSSPVKNIFKQMGNTMEALQEAFQERKTQAMMNVLKNSGAFDLAKNVLSDASNSGIIGKVESFFTEKLKRIIDFLKTVDWDKVGNSLKDGLEKIKDGILTAYNTVKQSLPDVDGWKVVETIFTSIRNMIVGFGDGIKVVVEFAKRLTSNFSPEIVEKAASAVGFLLSPAQKLFSYIGTLATTVTNIAQNLNKTISKFTQTRIEKYNKYVDKAAEAMANAMGSQENLMEYYKQFDNLVYHPDTDTYTGYNKVKRLVPGTKDQYTYDTKVTKNLKLTPTGMVDAAEYRSMSLRQRADTYYGGSMLKTAGASISNWGNRVMNTFVSQMNKLVMGGQILAFGAGLQSMVEKTNTFGQAVTEVVKSIGTVMMSVGLGKTVGSMFGFTKMGGIIGGIAGTLVSIYNVVNAAWEAERQKRLEDAKNKRAEAVNDYVETLANNVMDALGIDKNATDSGRYTYDSLIQMLNKEDLNDIIGQGKYGGVDDVLKKFTTEGKLLLNRFYRSDLLEQIDDFVNGKSEGELSEEAKAFHAATGAVHSNWGDDASEEDKAIRTWLAGVVREHGLLSNGEVGGSLENATDQRIVETFLEDMDGTINDGQLKILKDKVADANTKFPSEFDKVASELQSNSTVTQTLNGSIETLNTKVQNIIENGIKVIQNSDRDQNQDTSGMTNQEVGALRAPWSHDKMDQFKVFLGSGRSVAYNWAKGEGGLFDEGTEGVLNHGEHKKNNGGKLPDKLGGVSLRYGIWSGDFWRALGNGENYMEAIYKQLAILGQAAQEQDRGDWLEKIGEAYRAIETKGSFVGLSAEDSQKKMAELLNELYDIFPDMFKKKYYAVGGSIKSMAGRGVDTVPAFLQPGEFVMRRGSVMKAGVGVMSALNRGDLAAAARGLGAKLITGGANNSRSWSNTVNNNQRTNNNVFNIVNRNLSARTNTYNNLANRIATI